MMATGNATARRVGEEIRRIRRKMGLTQPQFAAEVGVSRAETVSDWERGKYIPEPEKLDAIANYAGEDAEVLRQLAVSDAQPPDAPFVISDAMGAGKSDIAGLLVQAAENAEGDTLRLLWMRLDAIDRDEALTPTARLLKREQELAAYRQVIQEREARAAEGRSRAIEKEAENANGRARRIAEEQPGVEATIMAARKIRELSEAEWRKYQTQLREHQK